MHNFQKASNPESSERPKKSLVLQKVLPLVLDSDNAIYLYIQKVSINSPKFINFVAEIFPPHRFSYLLQT